MVSGADQGLKLSLQQTLRTAANALERDAYCQVRELAVSLLLGALRVCDVASCASARRVALPSVRRDRVCGAPRPAKLLIRSISRDEESDPEGARAPAHVIGRRVLS